jgi:hypothetical protein
VVLLSIGSRFVHLPIGFANDVIYFAVLVALLTVRNKRANVALLAVMLAKDAVVPLLTFLGIGVHGSVF